MATTTVQSDIRGRKTGEDLSGKQYYFVKLMSDNTIDLVDAITDVSYGVQQNVPDSGAGKDVSVKVTGETKVIAAEALVVGDYVAPTADGKAQVAVATQNIRGIVTTGASGDGVKATIELFRSEAALTANILAALTLTGGAATAVTALAFGSAVTNGLLLQVIEEDIVIGGAAAAFDLTQDIPDGAVIVATQLNLETIITATTAVKVGLGIAANPDLYGLSGDLLKNTKVNLISDWAVNSGAVDMQVYACDIAGAAAGTLDSGTVKVKVYYYNIANIPDAA